MRPPGVRAASVVVLLVLAAMPLATGASYDAKAIVFSIDGLEELPPNYEYKANGDLRTYTVTGRVASETARVFLNVTSPANVRTGDDSKLTVEYPVSWTQKGFSNDTRPQGEAESASVSFALGRLPADLPTTAATVKATVDKTVFTLRILPAEPVIVIDAPSADGIAYVDVTNGAPIQIRTLYFPDGDRLTGPGFLGGKALAMPGTTDIRMNGKMELRAASDVACGLHPMSVASVKDKDTSTRTGTIYGAKAGPLDAVAVLRTPAISFPAGFVTDVAPAEVSLKCFPPQSRVQILWGDSADDLQPLATFTVADSGGLDEFVSFPALGNRTSVTVQARVVQGPAVLQLGKYAANATVNVKEVASSDELNLVVEASTDRRIYDLGDVATVSGTVTLAGKPASGVDVTVVWPFEDTGSSREDRLQARTVRTDAQGAFTAQLTAAPVGTGASFAPSSTAGERVVLVTARKVGLNTGVDRAGILSTGVVPYTLSDVKWRPEVVQPGASAVVTGTIVAPGSVAGVAGVVEGARVEVRSDPLTEVAVGTSAPDGTFSVPVTIPETASEGAYPTSVVVWGRAPPALGGLLTGAGSGSVTMKIGSIDVKPVGKDQRVAVKTIRSLGGEAASANIVHEGQVVAAGNGVLVANGDRIEVARGSELVTDLPDQGATATFGNGTRAQFITSRIAEGKTPTVVVLSTPGEMRLDSSDAAPSGERSVVVLTRFHDVDVTAADAVVRALPDGGVEVEVWKGTATVTNREGGPSVDVASGKKISVSGDTSIAEATQGSLKGSDPFSAPPPPPTGTEGPTDGDGSPTESGNGGKTPFPWLGAVAVALGVALARRSRARS